VPAQSRLAQLIAREEGFGKPGEKPTRDHNPGDLEHAPGIYAWDGAIGIEPNDDQGWEDLERQLRLYAQRNLTLNQLVTIYAPPGENNTEAYLEFLCAGLRLTPADSVMRALQIPAETA
jgi:hypothetical protein